MDGRSRGSTGGGGPGCDGRLESGQVGNRRGGLAWFNDGRNQQPLRIPP
jgi:hypothetical protein